MAKDRHEILSEIILTTWKSLRREEEFLKLCQFRYFAISVTSVVAFVGYVKTSQVGAVEGDTTPSWLFLLPLLVTLPCWWIYFDKAKTIARIVGYLRILERLLARDDPEDFKKFAGWQSAMGLFREKHRDKTLQRVKQIAPAIGLWKQIGRTLTFDTPHKYWTMHFWTFLVLSLTCIGLAMSQYRGPWLVECGSLHPLKCTFFYDRVSQEQFPIAFAAIILGVNTWFSFRLLLRLIFGMNSYEAHWQMWRHEIFGTEMTTGAQNP